MKRIVWYGVGLISLGFLGLCVLINLYGMIDHATPADVIVTLGARVLPDGTASADLLSRTAHSAALFNAGYAPYLVCTGGVEGDRSSAAAVARNLAVQMGVPAERIWLAENSMSTQEDAEQVAKLMETYEWKSAVVVSHPLHLLRARFLFALQGVTVLTSPTPLQPGEISLEARVYYTTREAFGVIAALLPEKWLQVGEAHIAGQS